jgi:cytoplasmic iron level regulating protein YaaA (DUF328/UPF0246 family)
MRILLPPSEAKNPGGRGRRLATRAAGTDALSAARAHVQQALAAQLRLGVAPAATALVLPPAAVDEALAANAHVLDSPTMPALHRYAGVVYAGLAADRFDAEQRRLAERSTLIFSGLFGVVGGDEPIPTYRVPAKAQLAGVGVLGTFWRPVLTEVLPGLVGRHLVIDLRSTDYLAMWRPRGREAERVLQIRVLSPRPNGTPAVISYPSKFGKGQLARALVERAAAGTPIRTADDVVAAWLGCGGSDADLRGNALDLVL